MHKRSCERYDFDSNYIKRKIEILIAFAQSINMYNLLLYSSCYSRD